MKLPFLFLLFLSSVSCHAQWKASAGINLPPLIARSVEVSSELSRHPGYSLIFQAGQTFKSSHIGLTDYKVDDRISQRKTSGTFLKAGGRIYPGSLSGKQQRNRFFAGALLIFSHYNQTALMRDLLQDSGFGEQYTWVSAKGTTLFPAATIGFQHQLTRSFILEWGVQKSFVIRRDNYLGSRQRNYQPGAGSAQSDPFIGYFQGIVAVKYQFAGAR
ncbi:hypothetical protein [Dyadobacter sandarakinus]|uniref:Outer membrane protein beta-barrel domain-containing protein n=1 Tax=Dyadobacter sandarakinus TaxID=2747268 RepID=A0ABX7I3C3_9BACT|nr:hypothetical protein [Dyadobacter sandarakinus]QRR00052.1 hypothetical protein HWI92_03550 [Dyadobacter sandarakinus]